MEEVAAIRCSGGRRRGLFSRTPGRPLIRLEQLVDVNRQDLTQLLQVFGPGERIAGLPALDGVQIHAYLIGELLLGQELPQPQPR